MGWFDERAGLRDSVAVVTGGAGGLGTAIVADLVANGVRVAVIDRDPAAAAELSDVAASRGHDCLVQVGDARDADQLADLFGAVDERWGRLDTLVNVAGGTFHAPFVDTTPKGWDALIRANLGTVLSACSLAVARMRDGGRGGSIVNITTIEAHRAAPGYAVYAAAKAGVEQFARTLAVEVAPYGIRVNNIAPDYVPTPGLERLAESDTELTDEVLRIGIPMGRAGVPSDVSHCVVFLASALSSYVTGSTLHPDGGTYASSGWFNWPETGWRNRVPSGLLDQRR